MPTLTIRNVSKRALDALKRRADAHGWSVEDEVRDMLETSAREEQMAAIRKLQAYSIAAFGGPDAARGVVDEFLANRLKDWGEA